MQIAEYAITAKENTSYSSLIILSANNNWKTASLRAAALPINIASCLAPVSSANELPKANGEEGTV